MDQTHSSVRSSFSSCRVLSLLPSHYLTLIYVCGVYNRYWNSSQVWQRQNQIPFERDMSCKAKTTELLRKYAKEKNGRIDFIPESYILPNDKDLLLKRLTLGPGMLQLRRGTSSSSGAAVAASAIAGGDNEPWVVKLSAIDVRIMPCEIVASRIKRFHRKLTMIISLVVLQIIVSRMVSALQCWDQVRMNSNFSSTFCARQMMSTTRQIT